MGGFNLISQDGTSNRIRDSEDIPDSHIHILEIYADEINDRSKGDLIAKIIAVIQTLWFMVQVAVRDNQGLIVTALETTTLLHTILNIFVYLCWWNKPVGIVFPFDVYPIKKQRWNPSIKRRATKEEEEAFLGRGKRPRQLSLRIRLGKYIADVLTRGGREPSWKIVGIGLCVCLVGSVFRAIQSYFAWNIAFPTGVEGRLWRISALMDVVSPSAAILLGLMCALFSYVTKINTRRLAMLQCMVFAVVYAVARLCLLVLAILELRDIPYGAYLTPSWTIYLPHIA